LWKGVYRNPQRWPWLFAHAVFYEGWTFWCEQMLLELKVELRHDPTGVD
jgi:hypothetical protein